MAGILLWFLDMNWALSLVHEVDNALATRDEILRDLKIHLSRSVHQMKQLADKKRRDVEFHPGDFVYLKLQPYRQ